MDIRILQERIEENLGKLVWIFNPTSKEFSLKYRNNTYTALPSSELELPYYGAELMVKKITDYMVNRKLKTQKVVSAPQREEMANKIRLYEQNDIT